VVDAVLPQFSSSRPVSGSAQRCHRPVGRHALLRMTTRASGGPPVLLREATPVETAAAIDLVVAAGLPLASLSRAALVLVAEAAGALVGTVALERHGTGGDTAFLLRSAAVGPAWRGRGVGAALTAAALARVDGIGACVALLTGTAAGCFSRFGFVPAGRDRLPSALSHAERLAGDGRYRCPAGAARWPEPWVAGLAAGLLDGRRERHRRADGVVARAGWLSAVVRPRHRRATGRAWIRVTRPARPRQDTGHGRWPLS
jgi:predicted N-acetyltransferase YhbS